MMPSSPSFSLKVVATETLSNTASTATPASISRSLKRDAELVVSLEQLGIDFVQAFGAVLLGLGGGVVDDVLVVDGRIMDIGPGRLRHGLPMPKARRRHSSMNSGSFFFAEIRRMTSSFRPGGTESAPMSVMNPYWYSRAARDSIVSI